jgi:hypothetical protein
MYVVPGTLNGGQLELRIPLSHSFCYRLEFIIEASHNQEDGDRNGVKVIPQRRLYTGAHLSKRNCQQMWIISKAAMNEGHEALWVRFQGRKQRLFVPFADELFK